MSSTANVNLQKKTDFQFDKVYSKRVTPYLKPTEKQVEWNPIVSSRKGSQTLKITAYFLSLMVVGSFSQCPPATQKNLLTFPSSWKLFSIDIFLEKKNYRRLLVGW